VDAARRAMTQVSTSFTTTEARVRLAGGLCLSRKSRTATRGDEGKISARSFHALPTIAPAAQLLPTALVGRSLSQGKAPRKATLTAAGRRRPELPQGREHSQLRSWALSRVRSGFWMSFSPSAHTSAKGRQRPFFRELVSQFRARVALPPNRDIQAYAVRPKT
jgi:hypothetical protein